MRGISFDEPEAEYRIQNTEVTLECLARQKWRPSGDSGGSLVNRKVDSKSAALSGRFLLLAGFPGLKPWAEIGVGTKESFAPPSEPDWQFSCIRLSSWWLTFKKIGVPQRAVVLRRTSRLRRRRYLATGIDRFLC